MPQDAAAAIVKAIQFWEPNFFMRASVKLGLDQVGLKSLREKNRFDICQAEISYHSISPEEAETQRQTLLSAKVEFTEAQRDAQIKARAMVAKNAALQVDLTRTVSEFGKNNSLKSRNRAQNHPPI